MFETAINFAQDQRPYVADFKEVWQATHFLNQGRPATNQEALAAARVVTAVLENWGAGKRRAPRPASVYQIARGFEDRDTCRSLGRLRSQQRNAVVGRLDRAYHAEAIDMLSVIAKWLFEPATVGLVYPAKALMLLTGIGPAPDSRVRAGLGAVGVGGWTTTQQLLPTTSTEFNKLIQLWNWCSDTLVAEWPTTSKALMANADVAWVVNQGAYGRIADMALFAIGEDADSESDNQPPQPADSAPTERRRRRVAPASGATAATRIDTQWQKMETWSGVSTFAYREDGSDGYEIKFGSARQTVRISGQLLSALRAEFGSNTVSLGTSRTNPPGGSLGEWLQRHLTPTATASYVGPLLVNKGLAARDPTNSSQIRVFA